MSDPVARDVQALVADLLPVLLPQATFEDDTIVIPLTPGERARVVTRSLVEVCRDQPQHTWPRVVDSWLRQVQADAAQASAQAADTPADPNEIPERLRLRLVPRMSEGLPDAVLTLAYDAHFDAVYVIDHTGRVDYLTKEQAARLGPEEELRQVAINNTVQAELVTFDVRDHPVTQTESVRLVAKDGSLYVPTGLMVLHRYFVGQAPYGALVSVPRYSMMLIHEVASPAALDLIYVIYEMTQSMYESAEDRCTPQVFWWLSGTLHPIEVTPTDDPQRPRVNLPPELEPVVDRLGAG
jgi:hypothetical protein